MSPLRIPFVRRRHAYTSKEIPWDLDTESSSPLYKYLRGGGIKGFGASCDREILSRRQTRFFCVFAALFAIWLTLWFI